MKRFFALIMCIFLALSFAACDSDRKVIEGSMELNKENFPKIISSDTQYSYALSMVAAVLDCTEAEAKEFVIKGGNVTDTYKRFADGEGDILFAHEPSNKTADYLSEKGVVTESITASYDALVFVTGAGNTVSSLTTEQLNGIFGGTITAWNLGCGSEAEIKCYLPKEDNVAAALITDLLSADTANLKVPTKDIVTENGKHSAETPFDGRADSLTAMLYSDYCVKSVHSKGTVKAVAVDNVAPTDETIKNGQYKFVTEIYFSVRNTAKSDSCEKVLFKWLNTAMGREVMNNTGLILAE